MAIYSGFSHWNGDFPIAMLVYQRVPILKLWVSIAMLTSQVTLGLFKQQGCLLSRLSGPDGTCAILRLRFQQGPCAHLRGPEAACGGKTGEQHNTTWETRRLPQTGAWFLICFNCPVLLGFNGKSSVFFLELESPMNTRLPFGFYSGGCNSTVPGEGCVSLEVIAEPAGLPEMDRHGRMQYP